MIITDYEGGVGWGWGGYNGLSREGLERTIKGGGV